MSKYTQSIQKKLNAMRLRGVQRALARSAYARAGGVGKPKAKAKLGANRKSGTDAHWITVNGRHVMVSK